MLTGNHTPFLLPGYNYWMTIQEYQRQVQTALKTTRLSCRRYPIGEYCMVRFWRAERHCFMLFCEQCGHSEAHQVTEEKSIE